MEKHLKDYLHLYLGCQILNTGINKEYILKGYEKDSYKDKLILKRWIGSDPEDGEWSVIGNYISEEFKLLLRPLSDVSEDEWSKIEYKSDIAPDAWGYNGLRDNFIKGTSEYRFHWTIVNWAINELRKMGVDMDGLIEAGLAIEKTKMK